VSGEKDKNESLLFQCENAIFESSPRDTVLLRNSNIWVCHITGYFNPQEGLS